jgi:hypothetical protein
MGDGFPAGAQRRRGGRCLRWVFPASPRLCGRFPSGGGARRGRFSRRGAGAQRGDEPLLSWLSNCPSPLRTVSTDSKPFGRACRSIRRETWKRRRGEASGPCPSVKSVESVVNPPPYPDSAVPRGRGWDGFPAGAQRRRGGVVWGGYSLRPSISAGGPSAGKWLGVGESGAGTRVRNQAGMEKTHSLDGLELVIQVGWKWSFMGRRWKWR